MPFHLQQAAPAFRTVNPGVAASTSLPVGGLTYRELTLRYKQNGVAATEAFFNSDIEKVTLKINGITRWSITGKNLLMLNKYYGYPFNAGELIVPLSRHYTRTPQAEENLAWGTNNVSSFQIEVKLAAGAVAPELAIDCDWTFVRQDLGQIVEIHESSYDFSGAGKKEISDLPKDGALMALHLVSADITSLEVKVDEIRPIESDTDLTVYQNRLERIAGRSPQAGVVHFDTMRLNRLGDAIGLVGVQDFRVRPEVSQATNVLVVMEKVTTPLGLPRS